MKKTIIVVLLTLVSCMTKAQLETRLIKQLYVKNLGVTDTVDNMPINVAVSGNVIISGNQKVNATQYNATTIEQTNSGVTAWINQYNPTSQKSFVIASCLDGMGNVYNVGAIRTNTTNGIDYLIMKIDPSGTVLWATTYNGPNSTNDVASGVCLDNNGNLYVTGASDGILFSLVDYCTLRINSATGATVWVTRYDNTSMDIPTGITFDALMNEVVVSGSSGNSLNDWDFCTVSYNLANGAQTDIIRTPNAAGSAQDKILGIASDMLGNVYNVGTTYNGANYDIKLEKLDTALNVVYSKIIDINGFDDAGVNVSVDGNNNVIIVGSAYLSNGLREMVIRKYDKYGNFKWEFKRQPKLSQDAEALRVKIKSNNEYFVVGNCGSGSGQDIAILCLDSIGGLRIEKQFDGNGFRDRFMDMALDGNFIYVSARTMTSSTSTVENNISIKFEYIAIPHTVSTSGSGVTAIKYIDKDLWVSFDKSTLNMTNINNRDFTFGKLRDFVNDSTCSKIQNAIDPENNLRIDAKTLTTRKVYFDLTEADSLSQTRMGNFIKVPEFYRELIVSLPAIISTANAPGQVTNLKPDVHFAQLNHVFELTSTPPNDPNFGVDQGALHPTTAFPNGHINVDSTWAVTTGTNSIRTGIYDSGIATGHQDLAASFPGWDFVGNVALWQGDTYNHGTPMAGIIGAKRNNSIGGAGVAGGDAAAGIAPVTMYDCKVCPYGACAESYFAPAVLKGAQGANIGGFALNVMNWSMRLNYAWSLSVWANGVFAASINQMIFANRSGVAVASSKGNIVNLGTWTFPADWTKEITMSIGSSGNDGHYCKKPINCTNGSTQWGNIDFIAPGTDTLIWTTTNTNGFTSYDGTSSACAFVSGANSLMMSYRNSPFPHWDNMVHEDCENILRRSCTDLRDSITYPGEKAGYDTISGWGRINVYKAIKDINKNYYRFRHITETAGNSSVTHTTTLVFTDTLTWTNYNTIPTGTYVTQIYEKATTINYNLLPTETIIDSWPLTKESYGTKLDTANVDYERPQYSKIVSVNNSSAILKTYYYKIVGQNVWMPYAPAAITNAITLYTYDSSGKVAINENPDIINYMNFKVFPNPNTGDFKIKFDSDFDGLLEYKIINILGQVALSGTQKSQIGKNIYNMDANSLPNGVYFITIFDNNRPLFTQKIIKQ